MVAAKILFKRLTLLALLVLGIVSSVTAFASGDEKTNPSVGIGAQIKEVVIKGSEVEVRPLTECKIPLVVRIVAVRPHGSDFRYDISYYGLETGTFDLRKALRRKDKSSQETIPEIPVTIRAVLAKGKFEPNPPNSKALGLPSRYKKALIAGSFIWVLGLIFLIVSGRPKVAPDAGVEEKALSLADRLQPLVEAALNGKIDSTEKARLERLLLSYWRKRLNLGDLSAGEALMVMREHEEGGRLLRKLEEWLHRPGPKESINIEEFLSDYRDIPADDLDLPGGSL
jgi:hypothetical protein